MAKTDNGVDRGKPASKESASVSTKKRVVAKLEEADRIAELGDEFGDELGLLAIEDSDSDSGKESDDEYESKKDEREKESKIKTNPTEVVEDSEEDDSEEESLNRLLQVEEGEDEKEDEDEDEQEDDESDSSHESEPNSLHDRLYGIKLKTIDDSQVIHTKYSDGRPRIIKPEINPVYDSDDSDAENFNTIGNIPISAYEEMPHMGYDINGRRIMRPARGSALNHLLEQIELPAGWTGLLDQNTGQGLNLSTEELELIRKIQNNENTDESLNPYEPTIEWFTSKVEVMPLSARPEPKGRFMPSRHEAKKIMKIVKAIREGKIISPNKVRELEDEDRLNVDLWEQEGEPNCHVMNLRAPKLAPPTNDESYNPPEEYLLTEEEKQKWLETEPHLRETNFVPQKYSSLRKVPGYHENIREKFDRCLDLYLAPRVNKTKLNIDPESLIPELPSPQDLRPFPIRCSTQYLGHTGRVRCISVNPLGLWLATGSDDGTVRVWEVLTGREMYKLQAVNVDEDHEDRIDALEWHPDPTVPILAVGAAEKALLVVPTVFNFEAENNARVKIEAGWGYATFGNKRTDTSINVEDEGQNEIPAALSTTETKQKDVAQWYAPSSKQNQDGIAAIVECKKPIKKLTWHRKGDYFLTVAPESKNTAVLIHQLSKHLSQSPFRKSKGIIVDACFHPIKPQLFVSSQRTVRIYDLAQQVLIKKLMPGARILSCIDLHPRGDHLLASSYDKRVLWHDLDMSATPYKTLRYHTKAVRCIKFHKGKLPLFASASDDGSIHVFHGEVYDDFITNPLLVPLKKLTGHKIVSSVGVLSLVWHPKEAWLFSAGADGTARLWTT